MTTIVSAEASGPTPAGGLPDGLGLLVATVVSTGESPSYRRLDLRLRHDAALSPGRLVAVEACGADGTQRLVLARIDDVHEVNPYEDAAGATLREVLPFDTRYAGEGSSTVIWRQARAEPLEEAVLGPGRRVAAVRAVETLPRAGAAVFAAGSALTAAALGLRDDPALSLEIGAVHGDPTVPVQLAREIVQRHVFIGGGIGSGKSYTRGVLAEEMHRLGIPQVNIDVNGEMIDAASELGGRTVTPGRGGFTLPLSALSPEDVVDAVPSINRGTNMETLLRFAHETLLKDVAAGRREHFGVADLVGAMDDCAWTLELTSGSGEARKLARATVEPVKLRTASLSRLPFLGPPFDWAGALVPGAVVNVDCRGLLVSELRLVVASIARDLQQLARARRIPFTVFSIDEFHLVAPADGTAVTTQALREIARLGRHYRLGLVLTTQSPSDVDRSVLKRLLTRFIHAIEPDQLDALRGVFADASPELVRALPKLPQGTCVLTGSYETVRHAVVVDVRERDTTHGGRTPDVFAELAAAGWAAKAPRGGR